MAITAEQLVNREVFYCVSHLVSELASKPEYMDDLMPCLVSSDTDDDGEFKEALEHWIVSDWLANWLEAKGELIVKDFLGLTIWGRCTSGQLIAADYVIEEITAELNSRA